MKGVRRGAGLALVVLALDVGAQAAPPPPPPPLAPLPMLPSIARTRLTFTKGQLLVVEDVTFPRGEWRGEPFDVYVAFGAPGPPRAIDAHLLAIGDGELEPPDDAAGTALVVDRVTRRPPTAHPLLGRDAMAGIVVHVTKAAMTRALEPGGMASLRVRTALDLPDEDPSGGRSVVVRLGASRGTPLTLGRIVVSQTGGPAIQRAEARLCGPDADEHPLAVHVLGRPREKGQDNRIAPVLAVRHATDDLCARVFFSGP